MGLFRAEIEVADPRDGIFHRIDQIVDTGAAYSMLPASFLQDTLGLTPEDDERSFKLADGSSRRYRMGEVRFRFGNLERTTPVIFGPEDVYLLGAVSLQNLGLIADTTNHKLIPTPELYLVGIR